MCKKCIEKSTKKELIDIYKGKDLEKIVGDDTSKEKTIYERIHVKLANKKPMEVKAIRADLIKGVLPELITNAFSFVAIISSFILGLISRELNSIGILILGVLIVVYAVVLVCATLWLQKYKYVLQVVNDYIFDNYK